MQEPIPYSSLSDDELLGILKSKPEGQDWKVAELREVKRRGKSILSGDVNLEKRFDEYESKLRHELEDIQAELDKSTDDSEHISVVNQLMRVPKSSILDSFTASQSAVDAITKQARDISGLITSSAFLSSINASQSAVDAITKQAREIAAAATKAAGISLAQSTLVQISNSIDIIDAARRSAEMLVRIPTQLSMIQDTFFIEAQTKPMSILPESSNDYEVNRVIDSREFETIVKSEVATEEERAIEMVLTTISTISSGVVAIREGTERSIALQEESVSLMKNGTPSKYWIIVSAVMSFIAVIEWFFPRRR